MRRYPLYNIGKLLVPPIFKLLFFYRVNHKNSLPSEGGYIVCCNHISLKDPGTEKANLFYGQRGIVS